MANKRLCEKAVAFLGFYAESAKELHLAGGSLSYVHITYKGMQDYFSDGEWTLHAKPGEDNHKYYELWAQYDATKFIVLMTESEYSEYLERLAEAESNEPLEYFVEMK